MGIEARWWVLVEEEPIDLDTTAVYELKHGAVLDGRTGAPLGTYAVLSDGVDLTFAEKDGDKEIIQFRMPAGIQAGGPGMKQLTPLFDPNFDGYSVDFTTAKLEEFRATLPPIETETADQTFERQEWEEKLGFFPTYGSALRDGPHIQEMHERNQKRYGAEQRVVSLHV